MLWLLISVSFAALTNADNKWDVVAAGVASVVLMIERLIECWEHIAVVSGCTTCLHQLSPLNRTGEKVQVQLSLLGAI